MADATLTLDGPLADPASQPPAATVYEVRSVDGATTIVVTITRYGEPTPVLAGRDET